MEPYLKMAKDFECGLQVIRCSGDYPNVHGVHSRKVKQMRDRMEDYIGEVCL